MRPIKFRAWDKDKKAMFFPSSICWKDNIMWACDAQGSNRVEMVIEKCDLMQFTGLSDKNGKEIWEGDIIIEGGNTAEVFWDQPFARWAYRTRTGTAGMYLFIGEVIGNIHENPELLK